MHRLYFFLIFFFSISIVSAQTFSVKGRLVDSVGKQSLKDASVLVLYFARDKIVIATINKESVVFL